jgi:hypothetical protein
MTYKQQVRRWIEEEYEIVRAGDTEDESLCDGWYFMDLQEHLVDQLFEKHQEITDAESYNDIRDIIREWWIVTASPEAIREWAEYLEFLADKAESTESRTRWIKEAERMCECADLREWAMAQQNPGGKN